MDQVLIGAWSFGIIDEGSIFQIVGAKQLTKRLNEVRWRSATDFDNLPNRRIVTGQPKQTRSRPVKVKPGGGGASYSQPQSALSPDATSGYRTEGSAYNMAGSVAGLAGQNEGRGNGRGFGNRRKQGSNTMPTPAGAGAGAGAGASNRSGRWSMLTKLLTNSSKDTGREPADVQHLTSTR